MVLWYGEPVVYRQPLQPAGFTCESLPDGLPARVNPAIISLQAGRAGPAQAAAAREAIALLRARNVDCIILGCTEVPLLLGGDADAPDLVNPGALLAEAAVRYAIG